ncbi:MAG: polyisoprenoid-binding protein [Alphaproteobacteria bacterium]|nr:polyisoprenoid-binding protein [Alphaproteobacteria bacterium]
MTKHLVLAALLSLTLASSASAQEIARGTPDLKAAASGAYTLDKGHANVVFSINHLGYSGYIGRFNSIDGNLKFDPTAPEKSSVSIHIDPASIDTNNAKLEEELKTDKFFNVAKFPDITFESTKVVKTSDTTGDITGNLTLMGVTKEVTLKTTFNGAGKNPFNSKPKLGFSAKGSIKRSDFGMSGYIPAVGDEVLLTIEVEFDQ